MSNKRYAFCDKNTPIICPSGVYVSNPPVGTNALRNIYTGTTDPAAGRSSLATGSIYFVYE